jgi:hypothetical protein
MKRSKMPLMAAVLFGLSVTSLHAAEGPGDKGGPPRGESTQVSGIVQSYNLDRRGSINGLIIKDGDQLAQLNVPPDQATALKAAAPVGQKIEATAMTERSDADHAVYRVQSLKGADGKELKIDDPGEGKPMHVEGTVKSLNYSPRGDADGAILDTGDFVQMGPGAARDAALAVGQKLSVDGNTRPMSDGHNIINPTSVNGNEVAPPAPPMGNGGPGGGPDHGPGGGGPGGDAAPPPPGN